MNARVGETIVEGRWQHIAREECCRRVEKQFPVGWSSPAGHVKAQLPARRNRRCQFTANSREKGN